VPQATYERSGVAQNGMETWRRLSDNVVECGPCILFVRDIKILPWLARLNRQHPLEDDIEGTADDYLPRPK